ncbi:hypothetical protein [Bradyrhizobium lupini]|uniref:hypothetical protein n=1 Tax=Rhizobium lupini TaxID=136996 RepID=UPI0034C6802D
MYYYANGTETDYSPSSFVDSAAETNWTSYTIGNVVYVNRADRPPWFLLPDAPRFADISAATYARPADKWDPSWTAKIIAQCGGAVVMLNVQKGPTSYPTMVKTSSIVENGMIPASWDIDDPATLATENILQAMDGPIMDACQLGSDLIIYGQREAWRMHADGSVEVFAYTKLSSAKGVLNTNCSIELDGKNYCFGIDDIWVHDGISEKSLCDEKTRDFIFSSLNISQADKCWVQFNPRLNEISFGYVSGDDLVKFKNVNGCNRAAVYNLSTESWSFDDMPGVYSYDDGPVSNLKTYATINASYADMGGSYQDQEDGGKRVTVCVGEGNAEYGLQPTLYAFDVYGTGSVAPYPVDANATGPVYLERTGIDLDEQGAELRDYKLLRSIYPQARVDTTGGNALQIAVGASDEPNSDTPDYTDFQPYDGKDNYKVDVNKAGRWLAIKLMWNDFRSFVLTGFDLDIKTNGKR